MDSFRKGFSLSFTCHSLTEQSDSDWNELLRSSTDVFAEYSLSLPPSLIDFYIDGTRWGYTGSFFSITTSLPKIAHQTFPFHRRIDFFSSPSRSFLHLHASPSFVYHHEEDDGTDSLIFHWTMTNFCGNETVTFPSAYERCTLTNSILIRIVGTTIFFIELVSTFLNIHTQRTPLVRHTFVLFSCLSVNGKSNSFIESDSTWTTVNPIDVLNWQDSFHLRMISIIVTSEESFWTNPV